MPCERRQLATADRAATIRDVVGHLRAGRLCVLPTETVYGLALLPGRGEADALAAPLLGRREARPLTFHLARTEDAQALVGALPTRVRRLAHRYWPGPLTLVLPAPAGGWTGLRVPAHDFTRQVIAAAGEPLWLATVAAPDGAPMVDAGAIAARFGDALALVVDDGPSPLGSPSTVVRLAGDRLEVLREGILTAAEVLHAAARTIVFVCTGNTCRSPLAEAIARDLAARRLGTGRDDVLAHGLAFASAGTSTLDGMPASENSVLAAHELGLDLGAHASKALDRDLVARADRIYCLGQSHRRAILAECPEAADKVQLLRPDGRDVGDPYGGELHVYRRARDEIRAAIGARLPEWLND